MYTELSEKYKQWCQLTKRNGGVLVGGSMHEFFEWMQNEPIPSARVSAEEILKSATKYASQYSFDADYLGKKKAFMEGVQYALQSSQAKELSAEKLYRWVKASERMPDSWHLIPVRFIHTKAPIFNIENLDKERPKDIWDVVEWLEEYSLSTHSREIMVAVAFAEWMENGKYDLSKEQMQELLKDDTYVGNFGYWYKNIHSK